jgi:hypothetical protein
MLRRLLLDENVPVGMKAILSEYDVVTAPEMGGAGVSNGKLLDAAEVEGFSIMITADSNIRAQQNMAGRQISLVVLNTTHWLTIKAHPELITVAVAGVGQGEHLIVRFPRPPLRRRNRIAHS